MALKARVTGQKAFKRKLKQIPFAVVETVREEGLKPAARDIVEMMKRLAPVDDGDLRESIHFTFGGEKRIAYSQGTKATSLLSVRIAAGNAKVRTAHLVEFGTAPHPQGGIFAGTMHPGTPPQPFFYPAYRARRRAAAQRIKRAMRRGARKAFDG